MAIPDYQSLMLPVLVASSKGEVRIGFVVEELADQLALTPEERSERIAYAGLNMKKRAGLASPLFLERREEQERVFLSLCLRLALRPAAAGCGPSDRVLISPLKKYL